LRLPNDAARSGTGKVRPVSCPPARTATVADAWHTWLAYRRCGARPLRLSTIAGYESSWRCHLEAGLGPVALTEIDGRTIAGLVVAISAQGKSPKSLHNTLIPVRACLRWHYRMGTFDRDPTPWFDSPAPHLPSSFASVTL
jgi:site-specific recombinase XerD